MDSQLSQYPVLSIGNCIIVFSSSYLCILYLFLWSILCSIMVIQMQIKMLWVFLIYQIGIIFFLYSTMLYCQTCQEMCVSSPAGRSANWSKFSREQFVNYALIWPTDLTPMNLCWGNKHGSIQILTTTPIHSIIDYYKEHLKTTIKCPIVGDWLNFF